jgi:copper chaperone CopZ
MSTSTGRRERRIRTLRTSGREALRGLDHVSDVHVDASGSVVAVSYERGKAGREAIERAVEEAGYGVSRLSVRSEFEVGWDQRLWDI